MGPSMDQKAHGPGMLGGGVDPKQQNVSYLIGLVDQRKPSLGHKVHMDPAAWTPNPKTYRI